MYKFGSLTVSPFDWLDATYFYYRPSDLMWGPYQGLYLDKGFNVKLTYKSKNKKIPTLAIGLDDFAGTGQFSKEYIVGTYDFIPIKASLGIGWGKFVGQKKYKNPLTYLNESFSFRQADFTVATGGTLESKAWFRGPATFFGGVEYDIPHSKGLKLKIEYDPYDYYYFLCCGEAKSNLSYKIRNKESDINIGFSYPINNYSEVGISYFKGDSLNLSFTIGLNSKYSKNVKKNNSKAVLTNVNKEDKSSFYLNLMENLNKNALYLQTAELSDGNLEVAILQSTYNDSIEASINAANMSNDVINEYNFDVNSISIKELNVGVELNKITFNKTDLDNKSTSYEVFVRNTKIESGNKENFLNNEFKPLLKFPQFFSAFSPDIVSHVGSPSRFYLGGLVIKNNSEIQFSRNLILYSELHYPVRNNFDKKVSQPGSSLPHVRTEILEYLQQSDSFYIARSQLDYYFSPFKNLYGKTTIGFLERMYGGVGAELLYKPFYKSFSFGIEAFHVKRRNYDQRLKFLDHEISSGHFNFNYLHPYTGIMANIKYGKYLAGDVGYTLDLSRKTKKGFVAGFFFSRTNVSFEEFGEGSFDKGFYFKIPFDIFTSTKSQNSIDFKIKPLTRDGGAFIDHHNPLSSIMYNSNFYEIRTDWYEKVN